MSKQSYAKAVKASAPFSADMAAGSLLVPESRRVACLLLEEPDDDHWYKAIVVDNILQKKSPASAIRMGRLIKNRLSLMRPTLWSLIATGTAEVATQGVLATAIKHSRLLSEFMRLVVKPKVKAYDYEISLKDWRNFLEECALIDPETTNWAQVTRNKLGQVVFRILAEARYIESTRKPRIQSVRITDEVNRYLLQNDEDYVLDCMEIGK
jgi:hypothetical protein